ncbi:MAG: type II toxin-antitoxin system HicA family toxin [Synergistaceae bacterium]|nr:type II toxin-antitoxin system HicA family toxin [Synergistaceae bacterium]
MTVTEMIRRLKSEGILFKKHGKKHDTYYNPKTRGEAQISRHQTEELKKGTAERILKDLGLK